MGRKRKSKRKPKRQAAAKSSPPSPPPTTTSPTPPPNNDEVVYDYERGDDIDSDANGQLSGDDMARDVDEEDPFADDSELDADDVGLVRKPLTASEEAAEQERRLFADLIETSWQRPLDFDSCFFDSCEMLKRNLPKLVTASVVYFLMLVAVEAAFLYVLGATSLKNPDKPLTPAALEHRTLLLLPGFGERSISRAVEVLHIASLWFNDALVWGPAQASFFMAIFNAMRRQGHKIKFKELFYFYTSGLQLGRLVLISSVFFWTTWSLRLSLYLFPLLLVYHTATLFVFPFFVEFPAVSIYRLFYGSWRVVKGHPGAIVLVMLTAFFLQVVGVLCFVVGVFVTGPLALLMVSFVYHQLVGVKDSPDTMRTMEIA